MRFGLIFASLGTLVLGTGANATLVADFELNGTLANSAGTGALLTNNGGTLSSTGITFGSNQGQTISGLGALSAYTIDMGFTIDNVSGYVKLIDFSNLGSDNGYYNYGGYLNAYPLANSPGSVFAAGTAVRLTLSRSLAGLITAYIDGNEIYSQLDASNASATEINGLNPLTFFTDDFVTSRREASSGFVDYIRIFDTAVTPSEASPAPEPATWAMLVGGFGMIGGAMRRRRRTTIHYA